MKHKREKQKMSEGRIVYDVSPEFQYFIEHPRPTLKSSVKRPDMKAVAIFTMCSPSLDGAPAWCLYII